MHIHIRTYTQRVIEIDRQTDHYNSREIRGITPSLGRLLLNEVRSGNGTNNMVKKLENILSSDIFCLISPQ